MNKITCGRAIVKCLQSEGVEMVFGQPGSHNLSIYDALRETPAIRHINVKHEESAAVMADVFGRLTGRPGICLTTAGPGATNCVTGLAQAYAACSPVVHISGHCETTSSLPFHGLYDSGFLMNVFRPVTKGTFSIEQGSDVSAVLAQAFALARSGRKGPVHVEIPRNVLEAEMEPVSYTRKGIVQGEPDQAAIQAALKMLTVAEAPIILASLGVTGDLASEELTRLAEVLSAPIITPWNGRSAVPFNHPLAFGFPVTGGLGHFVHPAHTKIIKTSDLVLLVGWDPGEALQDFVKAHPAVIHLGHADTPPGLQKPSGALSITGDIKESLRLLRAELEGFKAREKALERAHETAGVKDQIRKAVDAFIAELKQPDHMGAVLAEISKVIQKDAVVTSDTGLNDSWMFPFFRSQWPHNLLSGGRYGALGFALPAAIAAKLCYPERQVVAICGDGGFLMSSADFGTAVENELEIIFVVMNDGHFGTIRKMQSLFYDGRHYSTKIATPDFALLGASYGIRTFSVDHFSKIRGVFEEARSSRGPVLVNIKTDGQVPFFSLI